MFKQNKQHNLDEIKKKILELEIQNESLDRATAALLEELEINSEQLTAFISDENNFSKKSWRTLQKEKNQIEEEFERGIVNIRNPANIRKAYSDIKAASHWLFVR